jgi:hypothetical protein
MWASRDAANGEVGNLHRRQPQVSANWWKEALDA